MVMVVIANAIFLKLLSFSINNYIIYGLWGRLRHRKSVEECVGGLEFGLAYLLGLMLLVWNARLPAFTFYWPFGK